MAGSTSLLIEGLRNRGHQVVVWSATKRVGEFKISTVPAKRAHAFDIVHLHGPTPMLSDAFLLLRTERPIVYTHHAEISFVSEKLSKLYRGFHRILAERAASILVESYDYAKLFPPGRARVIRPPVRDSVRIYQMPVARFSPFTVLYVGQLRPYKGFESLLGAARRLPEVRFMIVGQGYLRNRILRSIRDLPNVEFVGEVSDVALVKLYSQAQVICIPSTNTTEAFCLALVEGAINGCVPVATELLGVRETLSLLSGFGVPARDSHTLADVIRGLTDSPERWGVASHVSQVAAQSYASNFTQDAYVDEHIRLFESILAGTRSAD